MRPRQNCGAFITAIPTHIRNKLLMQPDTTTIIDLCSSSSKRLVLRSILLNEAVSTTLFIALTQDHLASNLTTAVNKMTRAQKKFDNRSTRFE